MDHVSLIDLETKSARVYSALEFRPDLAKIWRKCAAISEAGASLSLEDVPALEVDIVNMLIGSPVYSDDPQPSRIAQGILKAILAPGHLDQDPGFVFDRAMRAGRLSSIIETRTGGKVSFPNISNGEEWSNAKSQFIKGVPLILSARGPISLKSIAIGALLASVSPERHPIAERIVMMSAESVLRQDLALSDPIVSYAYDKLNIDIKSHWTLLPSLSLTIGSFRAWSPKTETGQADLISGCIKTLQREAGRIGRTQRWMRDVHEVFGRQDRKTRRVQMAELCTNNLIFNTTAVSEMLDSTDNTARNYLNEAQEAGLIREFTKRRSDKIWIIPALYDALQDTPDVNQLRRQTAFKSSTKAAREDLTDPFPDKDMKYNEKLDEIMDKLDSVTASTDRLLAKYIKTKTHPIEYNNDE